VREQQAVAQRFGVAYDLWQSERALHDAGAIATGIERLRTYGLTYDKDGALWLRTTKAATTKTRGRPLRRTPGLFRERRRLPLRQAAARRPRDRYSRPITTATSRACAPWPTPTAAAARSKC